MELVKIILRSERRMVLDTKITWIACQNSSLELDICLQRRMTRFSVSLSLSHTHTKVFKIIIIIIKAANNICKNLDIFNKQCFP
jgi:hypothetical protein